MNVDFVKTSNNRLRMKSNCKVCGAAKSVFIKSEDKCKICSDDLQRTVAKELHKPVIRKFRKRKIVTFGIDDLWAADLVIMSKYSSENSGFKYMLNVIDTFSKFAWVQPLKTKSGCDVAANFEKIIVRAKLSSHKAPNLLHVDKGREFVNKDFKHVLQKYGIKMYHTENEEKSAIVERMNRTLNEKMKTEFELRKSFKWIDIVQSLIDQYNNSFHRTIKMTPAKVTEDHEQRIRDLLSRPSPRRRRHVVKSKPKFKVGDRVRITLKKGSFANKYLRNWTREIFTITAVNGTSPVTYKIEDTAGEHIIGSFYEQELQKATTLEH